MTGGTHRWYMTAGGTIDGYVEGSLAGSSEICDDDGIGNADTVYTEPGSPSQPASRLVLEGAGQGDDGYLDVILYY